jgi:hypothetical protein
MREFLPQHIEFFSRIFIFNRVEVDNQRYRGVELEKWACVNGHKRLAVQFESNDVAISRCCWFLMNRRLVGDFGIGGNGSIKYCRFHNLYIELKMVGDSLHAFSCPLFTVDRRRALLWRMISARFTTGRISKDPTFIPGCLEIGRIAWLKLRASSIKIPPNCSFISAQGLSVTDAGLFFIAAWLRDEWNEALVKWFQSELRKDEVLDAKPRCGILRC